MDLCFVAYDASGRGVRSSPSRTGAIRSHARRAVHAMARRERMSEFQRLDPAGNDPKSGKQGAISPKAPLHIPVAKASPYGYLDSLRRDPFQSLAFRVNEVEQKLIDYYVTISAASPSPHCTVIISADRYRYQVKTQWVPFAFTDACLLNGLLLHACLKISAIDGHTQARYYGRLALQYKIACVHLLSRSVSREHAAPSDQLIASSLFLALYEINQDNMVEATSHVEAVDRMVRLRGGMAYLGLEGFLRQVVLLCRYHTGFELE